MDIKYIFSQALMSFKVIRFHREIGEKLQMSYSRVETNNKLRNSNWAENPTETGLTKMPTEIGLGDEGNTICLDLMSLSLETEFYKISFPADLSWVVKCSFNQ